MQDTQRISGKTMLSVFEQVQKEGTLITMHLIGTAYERLTIFTGMRTNNGIRHLVIDKPKGFTRAVKGVGVWRIRFEFTGRDKVNCMFTTSGGEFRDDEIWIRFPEFIERIQRRKHFRIEVPSGTRMHFALGSVKHEMNVINLCERGTLVCCGKGSQRDPVFGTGERLRHLSLVFPSEDQELKIKIKKAIVRRLKKDPLTKRYQYGIEFILMQRNEEKALGALICSFQREFLQKKLRLDY